MPNFRFLYLAVSASAIVGAGSLSLAAEAQAATGCVPGKPSVMVHVAGIKDARGLVKVSLYGDDQSRWLVKKGRIGRVKLPVTGRAMDICMPVPSAGRYAVAVHHDYNLNGERDRQDGGGYSRDPKVGLFNPKPEFSKASFIVGDGPARVGVTMLYIKGLGVGRAGS